MSRKKRYSKVLSNEKIEEIQKQVIESIGSYLQNRQETQQSLLTLLEEKGPEAFTWWLTGILEISKESKFKPDPRFYPELRERLEKIRDNGWPIDQLTGSRVGEIWQRQKLRFELPLNANIKDFLPAIQAFQEYFLSLEDPNSLAKYIADEHGRGRTYKQLSDELNSEILEWAEGKNTKLEIFGLDSFLRSRRNTPENYQLYDEERVRRLVKYYWTKK